jgi:hypothetical protein
MSTTKTETEIREDVERASAALRDDPANPERKEALHDALVAWAHSNNPNLAQQAVEALERVRRSEEALAELLLRRVVWCVALSIDVDTPPARDASRQGRLWLAQIEPDHERGVTAMRFTEDRDSARVFKPADATQIAEDLRLTGLETTGTELAIGEPSEQ